MKIALLYPPPWHIPEQGQAPDPRDGPPDGYREGDLDADFYQTPYGLFSIGAQAIRAGHQVKVLNLSAFGWPRVCEVVRALDADVMVAHVSVLAIVPELLSLALCATIAFVISQQLFRWEPGAKVPRSAKLWAASAVIPFLLLGVWESTHGQMRAEARQDYLSIEQPSLNTPPR